MSLTRSVAVATFAATMIAASPWAIAQDVNLARNLAATCANCAWAADQSS